MIQTAVARRYAKALFSLLQPSEVRSAADCLRMLAESYVASRDLRAVLQSPIFSREQKVSVIRKLAGTAGAPPVVEPFLLHVVHKNRIVFIREISEAFTKLADQASNRMVVTLASARPLSEENRTAIRTRLEEATRSTIDLTMHVDPHLLGGLQIRIGSTVYDGTIRGQLERMRTALAKAI